MNKEMCFRQIFSLFWKKLNAIAEKVASVAYHKERRLNELKNTKSGKFVKNFLVFKAYIQKVLHSLTSRGDLAKVPI